MDEKLKKALKTSKQGVWLILILSILLNGLTIYSLSQSAYIGLLDILKASIFPLIQIVALIIGLVLYSKQKYVEGAKVIQWSGMASIVVHFVDIMANYILLGKLVDIFNVINIIANIILPVIIPIILIIESLKVIRLAETGVSKNRIITVIALVIIIAVSIFNISVTAKEAKDLEELKNYLDNIVIKDESVNDKENEQTDNTEQNIDKEENKNDEDKDEQPKDEEAEKEPEKIDPYANYSKITWSDKSSTNTKISNNKLYFGNKEVKTGISGTLKSVETIMVGGFPYIYLLTEEGKAWYILLDDVVNNSIATKKQVLSKEKILDITALKTYTNKYSDSTMYFLTESGKLIDENGVSYNEYSFVSSLVDYSQGGYIPFDKNNYGYYYNENKNTYSVIVSKSNNSKLTFSKVYAVGSKLLVQTAYNKLFEYTWTGTKATQVGGTIKSINKSKNGDALNLVITFEDGTTKTYNNVIYGWNIKTNKEIDLNGLSNYDPYASYSNMTWAGKSAKDQKSGIVLSIEEGSAYTTKQGIKTKITGITGTSVKVLSRNDGQIIEFYILTQEGKVYVVSGYETQAKVLLKDRKYIDMTNISNWPYESVYYLAEDGSLVDQNGNNYKKSEFVGSCSGTLIDFPIDKNGYVYYYNEKTKSYNKITDSSGEAIKTIKVYNMNNNKFLLLTGENKIYEYEYEYPLGRYAGLLNGTVESIKQAPTADEGYILFIIFNDGTMLDNRGFICGYDVKSGNRIEPETIERIEVAG